MAFLGQRSASSAQIASVVSRRWHALCLKLQSVKYMLHQHPMPYDDSCDSYYHGWLQRRGVTVLLIVLGAKYG